RRGFPQARAPRRHAGGERPARVARQGALHLRPGDPARRRGAGEGQGHRGLRHGRSVQTHRDPRGPAPQDGSLHMIVSHDLTIIAMIMNASIVVKAVMGLLVFASMLSWTYIFMKL